MNKKFLLLISFTLIISMLISGCSFLTPKKVSKTTATSDEITTTQQNADKNMRSTILYYENKEGYIVPVMRKIAWEEAIGKAALTKLISTEENSSYLSEIGLKATLPEDAKIGLSIKNGTAIVNLNKEAVKCSSALEESNLVTSIVDTLTEFPAVQKVKISINGKSVNKLNYGTDISKPMSKTDINIESTSNKLNVNNASKVIVYYENENGDCIVPVTRLVSSKTSLETAVSELMKGPKKESNLSFPIPKGCKLKDCKIKDGKAIIDFSKEFKSLNKDQMDEKSVMKSIMLTCKQFPDIKEVSIQVEGKDYNTSDQTCLTIPTFVNEY